MDTYTAFFFSPFFSTKMPGLLSSKAMWRTENILPLSIIHIQQKIYNAHLHYFIEIAVFVLFCSYLIVYFALLLNVIFIIVFTLYSAFRFIT